MLKYLPLGALLLLTTPAFAAQPVDPAKAACRQTVESLCPGVQPGGGRLKACLQKQGKTLKEVCPQLAAEHHPNTVQSAPVTSGTVTAPTAAPAPTATAPAGGTGAVPSDSFPPNP